MAGDWLKMRHDLADDPAVIRIATACRIDEDAVVGKLHRLWSWADRHTAGGHADGVGLDWVDRTARCQGFAAEMVRVGWLEETGQGLTFPRFDRHCSESAKVRALGKTRVKRFRNAARVTDALPEKRREEVPPPPHACAGEPPDPARWAILRDAWKSGPGVPWGPPDPPDEAVARLAEDGWLDDALQAIGRLRGCKYFQNPVGLPQFCGPRFVGRVLQGRYDAVNPDRKPGPRGQDERRPAAEAAAEWQRKAEDPEAARRRAEYLESKARKAKARGEDARSRGDGDFEAARAAVLASIQEATK
jgi:hypothetical protein